MMNLFFCHISGFPYHWRSGPFACVGKFDNKMSYCAGANMLLEYPIVMGASVLLVYPIVIRVSGHEMSHYAGG